MPKSLSEAEREFYLSQLPVETYQFSPDIPLSELKRLFFTTDLPGVDHTFKTTQQIEIEWLQKYANTTATGYRDLWSAAASVRGDNPSNKTIDQIRYEFYIAQSL